MSGEPSGQDTSDSSNDTSHISNGGEAGIIILILIFLAIFAFIGYTFYGRMRARRLGLPPPALNPFSDSNRVGGARSGGIVGWIKEKVGSTSRRRTAGGAYEGTSGAGGAGVGFGGSGTRGARSERAFGGLDPDEAWDSRVGTEADGYGYEEQELSLRGQPAHLDDEETGYSRGNGRNELDARYDEEMGQGGKSTKNPFDDSQRLRDISPTRHSADSSGPGQRKSAFREAI